MAGYFSEGHSANGGDRIQKPKQRDVWIHRPDVLKYPVLNEDILFFCYFLFFV